MFLVDLFLKLFSKVLKSFSKTATLEFAFKFSEKKEPQDAVQSKIF